MIRNKFSFYLLYMIDLIYAHIWSSIQIWQPNFLSIKSKNFRFKIMNLPPFLVFYFHYNLERILWMFRELIVVLQFQLQCVVWYLGCSTTVVIQTANPATNEFVATFGNTNVVIFLPITNGLLWIISIEIDSY